MDSVGQSLQRRFMKSLAANGIGQVINILSQLATVPIFLALWGTQKYGDWLVLSSLPAFISLSDVGFATVGANRMTGQAASGNFAALRVSAHTLNAYLFFVSGAVIVLALVLALVLPLGELLKLNQYGDTEVRAAWVLLAAGTASILYGGVALALYRAGLHNARGVMAFNLVRLAAFGATIATVLVSKSIAMVAAAVCVTQVVGIALMTLDSRRHCPQAELGLRHAAWIELKAGMKPSFAFMAFPLGNAVYFQGMTLLVNYQLGSSSVVIFNTLRTLSRLAVQASSLIKHSAWPEFSILLARGSKDAARRLYLICFQAILLMSMGVALITIVTSKTLLHFWTHGHVSADLILVTLFQASSVVCCAGLISMGVLQSVNAHQRISAAYLCAYCAGSALAYPLTSELGLYGMAWAMLLSELLITLFCIRGANIYLGERSSRFWHRTLFFSDLVPYLKHSN